MWRGSKPENMDSFFLIKKFNDYIVGLNVNCAGMFEKEGGSARERKRDTGKYEVPVHF